MDSPNICSFDRLAVSSVAIFRDTVLYFLVFSSYRHTRNLMEVNNNGNHFQYAKTPGSL